MASSAKMIVTSPRSVNVTTTNANPVTAAAVKVAPTPSSDPPTPAQTDRLLDIIRQWSKGTLDDGFAFRVTDPRLWDDLVAQHLPPHIKDRYDYFADTNLVVLRMASTLHERFLELLKEEIARQLSMIAKGENSTDDGTAKAAEFAGRVVRGGSPTLYFSYGSVVRDDREGNGAPEKHRHAPDATFYLRGAKHPGLVIELSYSQHPRKLIRLADHYILGSRRNIRMMIGIDVAYPVGQSRRATFSVFVPESVGDTGVRVVRTVIDHEFSTVDGSLPESCPLTDGIHIPLSAFSSTVPPSLKSSPAAVHLSNTWLHQSLGEAIEMARDVQDDGFELPYKPDLELHRRSPTPEEQLGSHDERRLVAQEERAAERAERDDPPWTEGSG